MNDITSKEKRHPAIKDKIFVLGCEFNLIQSGDWRGAREACKTIRLPAGEVSIVLDLERDTAPGEIDVKAIDQAVIDFEITDPVLHTGDDHADFVTKAIGVTSRMPQVGLSVMRVNDNTKLHLTQRVHLGKGDMHWQEFDIEFDANGVVVDGFGSAEVTNDLTSPRIPKEADYFDITPDYGSEGHDFVSVNFGQGAMAKLLKKLGLPTNFQNGTKITDESEKPFIFDNVVPKIISLTTQKDNVKSLLESEL